MPIHRFSDLFRRITFIILVVLICGCTPVLQVNENIPSATSSRDPIGAFPTPPANVKPSDSTADQLASINNTVPSFEQITPSNTSLLYPVNHLYPSCRGEEITISPDGDLLMVEWGSKVCFFNAKTLEPVWFTQTEYPHENWKLSPDWSYMFDGHQIINVKTGKTTHRLNYLGNIVLSTISDDGSLIAAAYQNGEIILWNSQTGEKINTLKGYPDSRLSMDWEWNEIHSLEFSDNGDLLASSAIGLEKSIIWDTKMGNMLLTINQPVRNHAFSPDNRYLSGVTLDGVAVWEIATGKEIIKINVEGESLARTMDYRTKLLDHLLIVVDDRDNYNDKLKSVIVWDLQNNNQLINLPEQKKLAFSNDYQYLATLLDSSVTIWDTQTGQKTQSIQDAKNIFLSASFNPLNNSEIAVLNASSDILLWDFINNQEKGILSDQNEMIASFSYNPTGDTLTSVSDYGKMNVWDLSSRVLIAQHQGHQGSILSLAYNHQGNILASGGEDRDIYLWDTATGIPLLHLLGNYTENNDDGRHDSMIRALVFSPDDRFLASSCDHFVNLWDVSTGKLIKSIYGHSPMAFSPDGKKLYFNQGKKVFDQTEASFNSIDLDSLRFDTPSTTGWYGIYYFHPNMELVAMNDEVLGNSVSLYNIEDLEFIRDLNEYPAYWWEHMFQIKKPSDEIRTMIFSPEGALFATGLMDVAVVVWDVETGKIIHTLENHLGRIPVVSFSNNSELLASASEEYIYFWDLATGKLLRMLDGYNGHKDSVAALAFSPDGRFFASGGDDQNIIIWGLAP